MKVNEIINQDCIFDPCAGSGSHLLVASQLNRQWLGCELDPFYAEIAKNRLCEEN